MDKIKRPKEVIKNYAEDKFFMGASFIRVDELGVIDRVYRVDPRVKINVDDDSIKLDMSFLTLSDADKDSVEDLVFVMSHYNKWEDYEDGISYLSGTLDITGVEFGKSSRVIAKHNIYEIEGLIELGDGSKYMITLFFTDDTYLHGMSMFCEEEYNLSTLNKLVPYITHNSFGEMPVLAIYKSELVQANIYPYGFSDMIYVNPETKVWLLNSVAGRIGVDMDKAKGTIHITDKGYRLDIVLKDNSELTIYM